MRYASVLFCLLDAVPASAQPGPKTEITKGPDGKARRRRHHR
ncbi:MAG: hypothetical protein ABI818_10620 [Acidobacteriota bacterium]